MGKNAVIGRPKSGQVQGLLLVAYYRLQLNPIFPQKILDQLIFSPRTPSHKKPPRWVTPSTLTKSTGPAWKRTSKSAKRPASKKRKKNARPAKRKRPAAWPTRRRGRRRLFSPCRCTMEAIWLGASVRVKVGRLRGRRRGRSWLRGGSRSTLTICSRINCGRRRRSCTTG